MIVNCLRGEEKQCGTVYQRVPEQVAELRTSHVPPPEFLILLQPSSHLVISISPAGLLQPPGSPPLPLLSREPVTSLSILSVNVDTNMASIASPVSYSVTLHHITTYNIQYTIYNSTIHQYPISH